MASDGITKKAQKGTCRMCQRVRYTSSQVKAVGEVHHVFATGYIWECIDTEDCDKTIQKKLATPTTNGIIVAKLETAKKVGRLIDYKIFC